LKIIAEIGSNWKTLEDCLLSVERAKESGADAVKFQLFTQYELNGSAYDIEEIGHTPFLHPAWLKDLEEKCNSVGIGFMCTAFSSAGYHLVDPHVKIHKIASAEITDLGILKTVNSFKKPVLLSTGGADFGQIWTALRELGDCKVTLLYCVTAYPARIVDFGHLMKMKETFGTESSYGYSDHSVDVLNIPNLAQFYGCVWLEKHVNFTSYDDTNDAPHSLSSKEFALMCKNLKHGVDWSEAFIPCTWQRTWKTLSDGTQGFFRP